MGRFHARKTAKGGGYPVGRYGHRTIVWHWHGKENATGAQVPIPHLERPLGKDLVSQLDLYAVSLMERTGGYGPSDMGSIPVLRAIRRNFWVLQQMKLPVWCNWSSRAGVVLARSPFKSEDLFAPCYLNRRVANRQLRRTVNPLSSGTVGSAPTSPTNLMLP